MLEHNGYWEAFPESMIEVNFYTAIAVSKYSMLTNRTWFQSNHSDNCLIKSEFGYALYLAYDMLHMISAIWYVIIAKQYQWGKSEVKQGQFWMKYLWNLVLSWFEYREKLFIYIIVLNPCQNFHLGQKWPKVLITCPNLNFD